MAQWFYVQNNQQVGPVETDRLMQMLASGQVGHMNLVWRDGMANWIAAGSVPELRPPAAPAPNASAAPMVPNYAHAPFGAAGYGQGPFAASYSSQPSKLGMASVVIGIIAVLIEIVSIGFAAARVAQRTGRNPGSDPGMIVAGLAMFGGIFLAIVGIILGLIALGQKQQSRTLGIIGTIINGGMILLFIVLLAIGLAAR